MEHFCPILSSERVVKIFENYVLPEKKIFDRFRGCPINMKERDVWYENVVKNITLEMKLIRKILYFITEECKLKIV